MQERSRNGLGPKDLSVLPQSYTKRRVGQKTQTKQERGKREPLSFRSLRLVTLRVRLRSRATFLRLVKVGHPIYSRENAGTNNVAQGYQAKVKPISAVVHLAVRNRCHREEVHIRNRMLIPNDVKADNGHHHSEDFSRNGLAGHSHQHSNTNTKVRHDAFKEHLVRIQIRFGGSNSAQSRSHWSEQLTMRAIAVDACT